MRRYFLGIATFFAIISTSFNLQAADSSSFSAARDALRNEGAIVSINEATGRAQFVRFPSGVTIGIPSKSSNARLDDFLNDFGAAFGIEDHRSQLQRFPKRSVSITGSQVEMHQSHLGLPVFGGVLKAHFNRDDALYAVNGIFVDSLPDERPAVNVSLQDAGNIARAVVGKHLRSKERSVPPLEAVLLRQLWYHDGLLRRQSGQVFLGYELLVSDADGSVREFVYVDVQTGKTLNRITGIHEAADREVSEGSLANLIWDESNGDPDPIPAGWAGGTAQQLIDWQNEIDGSRETYNLFSSMSSGVYRSYDGAEATMKTVNNAPISCPNASWNGSTTNYCSGVTGDDTVAHEWGHAYTQFTSNLVYQYQSGALNESYSDLWGEVVDFLNARGTDTPDLVRTNSNCSTLGNNNGSPTEASIRWLSGEDDPAFGGAIRDMWYPECYNDPGSVTSGSYWCNAADSGGVHINSGVPNRAFALMVDGDASLGIDAMGLTKAAHLHWGAQNILTLMGVFSTHADALEASCTALTGVDLPALDVIGGTSSLSGEMINAADCAELTEIIAEVEFRSPNPCNYPPFFETPAPELCAVGDTLVTLFSEDWESGSLPAGWTVGSRAIADPVLHVIPDWVITGDQPADANGSFSVFGDNPVVGDCADDDQSGVHWIRSPVIVLDSNTQLIAIDHTLFTEASYDGGNIKISVNGGPQTVIPSGSFSFNGYNGSLALSGNTNPLAGEEAFHGGNLPEVGLLLWGQSQLSLSGIAGVGDSVQLTIELGADGCNGVLGWYVDDIHVYRCVTPVGLLFKDGFEE